MRSHAIPAAIALEAGRRYRAVGGRVEKKGHAEKRDCVEGVGHAGVAYDGGRR